MLSRSNRSGAAERLKGLANRTVEFFPKKEMKNVFWRLAPKEWPKNLYLPGRNNLV